MDGGKQFKVNLNEKADSFKLFLVAAVAHLNFWIRIPATLQVRAHVQTGLKFLFT